MLAPIVARLRDGRTWFLIGALALAYVISVILGYSLQDELAADRGMVWRNFYASWVQDVIFFTIVGVAVIAYTEPLRAESATFDERIQAFYGRRAPRPLRDYAKVQLTRYGGYAPHAERTMVIKDFDPERDAYKIEVRSKFFIRNLFDVEYVDEPPLQILPDSFDDPPSPFGEVEWITVGGQEQIGEGPQMIDHERGFYRKVNIRIPKGGAVEYEYRYWLWMKAGEKNSQRPQRVVELFNTKIRNATGHVTVKMEVENGDIPDVELKPGESYQFKPVHDATPQDTLFVFCIAKREALAAAANSD